MSIKILQGDCLETLKTLAPGSVHTCVTSPPYWGLRDYGHDGQLGLETTPDEYTERLVEVFREVWRVLRPDGTLWLNLGDSYASTSGANHVNPERIRDQKREYRGDRLINGRGDQPAVLRKKMPQAVHGPNRYAIHGLKAKDLVGIPWRVAFALQADGWYLRSDIIWHKPNPMPESVTDRPTKAHEYLFLLSKQPAYYYDHEAVKEPVAPSQVGRIREDVVGGKSHMERGQHSKGGTYTSGNKERKPRPGTPESNPGNQAGNVPWTGETRNKRSVWTVSTKPFAEAHFATFPTELVAPCIKAGSPAGGTVLDPFGGAGTTALVADRLGRNAILCELNPEYIKIAEARLHGDAPLLSDLS